MFANFKYRHSEKCSWRYCLWGIRNFGPKRGEVIVSKNNDDLIFVLHLVWIYAKYLHPTTLTDLNRDHDCGNSVAQDRFRNA